MGTLTTLTISTELLADTSLSLEQITNALTVLAISASRCPEESPRNRMVLGDLVEALQEAEGELGTYTER